MLLRDMLGCAACPRCPDVPLIARVCPCLQHPSPQALPSHPERKARKLERLLSKTALT